MKFKVISKEAGNRRNAVHISCWSIEFDKLDFAIAFGQGFQQKVEQGLDVVSHSNGMVNRRTKELQGSKN